MFHLLPPLLFTAAYKTVSEFRSDAVVVELFLSTTRADEKEEKDHEISHETRMCSLNVHKKQQIFGSMKVLCRITIAVMTWLMNN